MSSIIKRGRPLEGQSREIVTNVHEFMMKEAQEAKNKVFAKYRYLKVVERTAEATGISRRTVARTLKKKVKLMITGGTSFKTPNKGGEEWQRDIEHAIQCKDGFMLIEEALDDKMDKVVINLNDESLSSSSLSSSSSDASLSDDSDIGIIGP